MKEPQEPKMIFIDEEIIERVKTALRRASYAYENVYRKTPIASACRNALKELGEYSA